MENKEFEEKPSPTEQVTSTVKKTKPKDPGRIAAGKKLAEYSCFDKGCPKKAQKCTRQCRKVVWEILNKFQINTLKAQNPFCFFQHMQTSIHSTAFHRAENS